MTLPLPATSVSSSLHHATSPGACPGDRHVTGSSRRWDSPELRELLGGRGGILASREIEQRFDDEHLGIVKARGLLALPSLVIVAGAADVIIQQCENGNVLTGLRGSGNDCHLIFRHAYGRVRCTMRTMAGAGDVHVGLLDHRHFDEVRSFSILRPRTRRGSSEGSQDHPHGTLWTTLEYQAEPLCELQGLMWRGGALQIASLVLTP